MSNSKRKALEDRLSTFLQLLAVDLNSSPSCEDPVVVRQLSRMRKRAEFYKPEHRHEAIEAFIGINERVRTVNSLYRFEGPLYDHMRDFLAYVLERSYKKLYPESLQECIGLQGLLDNWTFGPGTSFGCTGTGAVEKIDQPMTCTDLCFPMVKQLRRYNLYFSAQDGQQDFEGIRIVHGNSLTTVLKNEDKERTIAKEPSGNMAIQLAGGHLIEACLRMIGIDLSTQSEKNKALARLYSKTRGGGTLDLSSASDMFSLSFVRSVWPVRWFEFFQKARSPRTVLPDGRMLDLEMVSTMGNGFTFPMMTLTLVALIYSVRRVKGGPYRFINLDGTAVFGDDIIVPSDDYDDVCAALECCGLVVNHDKSYNTGFFRESCGGDYLNGRDITPFYVRRLTCPAAIYVVINQLLLWCARHEICCARSLRYLFGLLNWKLFFVPQWLGETAGIRTVNVSRKYHYLKTQPVMRAYRGDFSVPLACGGYISSDQDGVKYSPRETFVKYVNREARLPSGYLDGWDPRWGTLRQACYAQLVIELAR